MSGRERGREVPIHEAPQAVTLYGALCDLFAYYHSHFRACSGHVLG